MKFKVGDKVRVVKPHGSSPVWDSYIGNVCTITGITRSATGDDAYELDACIGCWFDDELELVEK